MTLDLDKESSKFLERDFNQCFAQMRRYESLIWDICKFTLTAYATLLGIAIGIYKYDVKLIPAAITILSVGGLVGLTTLFLTVRNRVYFVVVARYINEHRKHFLDSKPLGFKNVSCMYTDPSQPSFYSWKSSQLWVAHMIAILNSLLFAAIAFISLPYCPFQWATAIAVFMICLAFQMISTILYLRSQDRSLPSIPTSGGKDNQ